MQDKLKSVLEAVSNITDHSTEEEKKHIREETKALIENHDLLSNRNEAEFKALLNSLLKEQLYSSVHIIAYLSNYYGTDKSKKNPAEHVRTTLHDIFVKRTLRAFENIEDENNKAFIDFVFNKENKLGNPPLGYGYVKLWTQYSLFGKVSSYIRPLISDDQLISLLDYLWQHKHLRDNHYKFVLCTLLPARSKYDDTTRLDQELSDQVMRAIIFPWCVDKSTKMHQSFLKDAKPDSTLKDIINRLFRHEHINRVFFILKELTQDKNHGAQLFEMLLQKKHAPLEKLHKLVGSALVADVKPFIDLLIKHQNWDALKPYLLQAAVANNKELVEYILTHKELGKLTDTIKDTSEFYNAILSENIKYKAPDEFRNEDGFLEEDEKFVKYKREQEQKQCEMIEVFVHFGCTVEKPSKPSSSSYGFSPTQPTVLAVEKNRKDVLDILLPKAEKPLEIFTEEYSHHTETLLHKAIKESQDAKSAKLKVYNDRDFNDEIIDFIIECYNKHDPKWHQQKQFDSLLDEAGNETKLRQKLLDAGIKPTISNLAEAVKRNDLDAVVRYCVIDSELIKQEYKKTDYYYGLHYGDKVTPLLSLTITDGPYSRKKPLTKMFKLLLDAGLTTESLDESLSPRSLKNNFGHEDKDKHDTRVLEKALEKVSDKYAKVSVLHWALAYKQPNLLFTILDHKNGTSVNIRSEYDNTPLEFSYLLWQAAVALKSNEASIYKDMYNYLFTYSKDNLPSAILNLQRLRKDESNYLFKDHAYAQTDECYDLSRPELVADLTKMCNKDRFGDARLVLIHSNYNDLGKDQQKQLYDNVFSTLDDSKKEFLGIKKPEMKKEDSTSKMNKALNKNAGSSKDKPEGTEEKDKTKKPSSTDDETKTSPSSQSKTADNKSPTKISIWNQLPTFAKILLVVSCFILPPVMVPVTIALACIKTKPKYFGKVGVHPSAYAGKTSADFKAASQGSSTSLGSKLTGQPSRELDTSGTLKP